MNKKKILKLLVIGVIAIALFFAIITTVSYLKLKGNIVGDWSREVYHNEYTNEDICVVLGIKEDGTYIYVAYNINTKMITSTATGEWKITPFKIRLIDDNKYNGEMVCKYNWITNTFKNGKLEYTKLED